MIHRLILTIFLGCAATMLAGDIPSAVNLRCDSRHNPLGVDAPRPSLSWQVDGGTKRAVRQSAYQILVATREGLLTEDKADLWNSGKSVSNESLNHDYGGKKLASRQRCFWKVRIWPVLSGAEGDQNDTSLPWSKPAEWTMGILSPPEWQGKWVRCAPGAEGGKAACYLRREVTLDKPVRRATARYACLGFIDLMVNGSKPDETIMLETPYTNPDHRVKYVTRDVTGLLRNGANCIAAVVGNGYNSPPSGGWNGWQKSKGPLRLLLEIEVEFVDGSRKFIGTDESWRNSSGRIRHNDFWVREVHDLREEQAGWNQAGFDDSGWAPVSLAEAPAGSLRAARIRPVRKQESVHPLRRDGNKYFFDKVYTGFPRVTTKGKSDDVVAIRGRDVHAMRKVFGPVVIDYTLADDREVTLEPRFFAHTIGPTLEINGASPLPKLDEISIVRVHGDLESTGAFECSNPLFNELHEIGLRTHLNYIHNYPNDPTREKAGWSEDIQNMFDSASYLTDTAVMYEQWWRDYADTQLEDGNVSSVAPTNIGDVQTWNDPWWGGMIVYAPWRLYEFYGDRQVLENAYEPMKRYVSYLTELADKTGGVLEWAGASDWIEVGIEGWGPPKRTPTFLVSTMAWHYYATILSRTAAILGKDEDVKIYRSLASRIRTTFNEKHFDPETGIYAKATDSQASLILPLVFGVVPDGKEDIVLQRLEENIRRRGDHLSTGFVSNPYLLHGLTDLGRADLVGRIMNQKDHPSFYSTSRYGVFMETWRAGMAQMPSLGGSCVGWFYRAVLGIRCDLDAPGFSHFTIKPEIMPEVTWAKGHYDSIRGRIGSAWKVEDGTITLHVEIPGNTSATVWVPADKAATVTESGKPASQAEGVSFLRMDDGCAVYQVGSGDYRFTGRVADRVR